MKKLIFIGITIFCTSSYGQTKASLNTTKYDLFKNPKFEYRTNDYTFGYKKINFSTKNIPFSAYNQTTKLNDNYLVVNNNYLYSKSNILFENNFRRQKIDSYNPYGASNVSSALVLGILGEFLNKIRK